MDFLSRLSSLFGPSKIDIKTRFELLREGIAGTMSKFYRARDRKTGEVVGLKVLDVKKTEAFEGRFKGLKKPSEGAIAVTFDHPSIVRTMEYGRTSEGGQYLVMEYIEGAGLNFLLMAQSEQLEDHRLQFIRQTAEAIQFVHEAGYIHRDVCPRNLMLAGDGETIKLIDFGLTVPAIGPFMQPGNRTGTPSYMAPELVRRFATDQRLDVFAFGVTAYELCTNQLPWPRGSTGLAALAHEQPPTDIREYRPNISPELAKAIHWCVEPELKKRCPSMAEFLRAIRRLKHEDRK
jgi:serine/threonine-protein kinase